MPISDALYADTRFHIWREVAISGELQMTPTASWASQELSRPSLCTFIQCPAMTKWKKRMRNLRLLAATLFVVSWISPASADDTATRELINVFTSCESRGDYGRVSELIARGADVNAYGCCGFGAKGGKLKGMVKLASDKSCDSNLYTPIQHLLRADGVHPGVSVDDDTALSTLRLLIAAGADPNKPENDAKGVRERDFPFTGSGRISSSSVTPSNVEKKIAFLKELVGAGMVVRQRNQSIGAVERYPQPFYDYLYSVAPPEFKKQMEERLVAVRVAAEERARVNLENEAARKAQEEQEMKLRQAREAQERVEQKQRDATAAQFRKRLAVGDETHCGMVIERKDPIVKIQTIAGEKWLKISQVYPSGAHSCRFYNGQYAD